MITTLKQKPYNYGIRKGKPPLTYNNISNCITSAPELVKWKWNNNVFTLEAGSIVTWCAGKEPPTLGVGDIYNSMPSVDISWDGTDFDVDYEGYNYIARLKKITHGIGTVTIQVTCICFFLLAIIV